MLTIGDRVRQFLFFKWKIIVAVIVILVVASRLVMGLLVHQHVTTNNISTSQTTVISPGYSTVTPNGESISKLGGWERVSPPKSDPVFAYVDTIDGVLVNVSEQPLPTSFKDNTDNQVAGLATAYNATDIVDAGSIKVYIGTSAKGPQSVIFIKDNLLILIKSEKVVADPAWATYVTSLK